MPLNIRKRPRRSQSSRPFAEPLEPRIALSGAGPDAPAAWAGAVRVELSGDVLRIDGTEGPDRILIGRGRTSGTVRVFSGGRPLGQFGPAERIEIRAGSGDDLVVVGLGVRVPTRIEGGPGDDRLRGGSGPDVVLGGDGDDRLFASPGRDALDSGPGSNRLAAPGVLGSLRVGPSVGGPTRQILARAYALRPVGPPSVASAGPMVVGAADLDDPTVADLLRRSYREGHPVALADAAPEDARRLADWLGHRGGSGWNPEVSKARLVAFRRADRTDSATDFRVSTLVSHEPAPRPGGVASGTIEWLSGVFSGQPILPDPPSPAGPGGTEEADLLSVADSNTSSNFVANAYGDQVQVVDSVWAVRSFEHQRDFYYVQQEVDYRLGTPDVTSWNNEVYNVLVSPADSPTLIQPSPPTTFDSESVTSSLTWDISGSVGWNQKQGVNASVTGGMSVTHSKTIQIPPIQVTNQPDFGNGQSSWQYNVTRIPTVPESAISFLNQWIWEIPLLDYTVEPGLAISFQSTAQLFAGGRTPYVGNYPVVPAPFGETFNPLPPTVTSVSPDSVDSGDTFTITGTGLYPSMVQSVLIDGTPLPSDAYSLVSDTEISVVAPEVFGFELPVVVQTFQDSNDTVTIEIDDL